MHAALRIMLAALLVSSAGAALAGEADVLDATATKRGDTWTFTVTVEHGNRGWDHYADRWDVLAPDGTVLGSRTLYHPHVGEQPFTRALSGLVVPGGTTQVVIRAHDSVDGLGGREFTLTLPAGGS
ncbi:MAG: hypothetical protein VW644_02405 [Alphaproteobacteria bacterium]|jgi:hypothetical protein